MPSVSSLLVEPESEPHAVLGARVRALRDAMGLSLRELAERCGVSAPMLSEKRLQHTFGDAISDTYAVEGIPRDLLGAQALWAKSPLRTVWAVSRVNGTPNEKQVGDRGVDGVIRFFTDTKGGTDRALVSVKGGQDVGPRFVRDLLGAVQTQKAAMGVLVTLAKPTRGMHDAADHAGTYAWPVTNYSFPKIQMLTVAELLAGKRPQMPPTLTPYIAAKRLRPPRAEQTRSLPFDG